MAEALRSVSARDVVPEPGIADSPRLETRGLTVRSAAGTILQNVDMAIPPRGVFGIIGPSGVGKSTLLRCLNRLIDLEPDLSVEGDVLLRGRSIYGRIDVDALRAKIGMLFQQPVVFPRSIEENVVFGLRRLERLPRRELAARCEEALRRTALFDEVEDRLKRPATELSIGQQQRLCLARALAVDPEVILMDEPTSALDPRSTEKIEKLILDLKRERTVVLVTHDMAQARRVADELACLCPRDGAGELVETACCDEMFENPQCREAIEFLEHDEQAS